MGVTTRVGSMSTTTDVIYTHKKFKRAAVEAWENSDESLNGKKDGSKLLEVSENPSCTREEKSELSDNSPYFSKETVGHNTNNQKLEKHSCKLCGFVNSNYVIYQQHKCAYIGITEKALTCKTCKQTFNSKLNYMNHDCFKFNISPRKQFDKVFKKEKQHSYITQCNPASSRNLNRSFSYPCVSEPPKEAIETKLGTITDSSNLKTCVLNKQLYKPKFRAQYSLQEELQASNASVFIQNNATHLIQPHCGTSKSTKKLDYSTSAHPSQSTYHSLTTPSEPSSSIATLHKVATSQFSSIWKGIKSPSPELVNQHITNLIVQNQAIVETHNPLWSIKYRRQSSSGSIGSENYRNKSRRLSFNDYSKGSKFKNGQARESFSEKCKDYFLSSSASGLPMSLHSQSVSHARASKLNISDSASLPKVKVIDVYSPNAVSMHSEVIHKSHQNFLNDFSYDRSGERLYKAPRSSLTENRQYCVPVSEKSRIINLSKPPSALQNIIEQGVVLNLHQQNNPSGMEFERSCSRESSISEPIGSCRSSNDDESNCSIPGISSNISISQGIPFNSSSNAKRRKLSNAELSTRNLLENGEIGHKPDYNIKTIDYLNKSKKCSSHIFGGEVQICDGNNIYRTIKIDSTNTDNPSLDLCIASKHLAATRESQEQPIMIPTSVVVTIAKCGLNSGGTMVKVVDIDSSNRNNVCKPTATLQPSMQSYSSLLTPANSLNVRSDVLPNIINNNTNSQITSPSKSVLFMQTSKEKGMNAKDNDRKAATSAQFPSILSVGEESVPYVPGIPGPYSQAGTITKYLTKHSDQLCVLPSHNPFSNTSNKISPIRYGNQKVVNKHSPNLTEFSINPSSISSNYNMLASKSEAAIIGNHKFSNESTPRSSLVGITKPPEIRIEPPAVEDTDFSKRNEEDSLQNQDTKFLVPRKRPNTLVIKPQSAALKSSLSLIGSTLVSPDTPRPKKSCAQLFLNGSAYTYLNLKVSTKTFFCCIYRPQPMYVLQSTNSKLSMYSNWQVRKSDNPLNISPSEAMSLHVSGIYYNRAYTISKSKMVDLIVTPSSYWSSKKNMAIGNSSDHTVSKESDLSEINNDEKNLKDDKRLTQEDIFRKNSAKRIKIFDGGFKTNEEYIYVRGRGRGRYVCETCGIRCKKPSMLKKHIRTHTDLRPFACKHCAFSFKTKGNLSKHLKSKAHYKRCTDMGIIPVPVVVDESHINKEALQLQEINNSDKNIEEDDEDEDDEEDEDDDEEFDDDEEMDDDDDTEISYESCPTLFNNNNESVGLDLTLNKSPTAQINHINNITDESLPMDLSIKRRSVIVNSDDIDSLRPNNLSLDNRIRLKSRIITPYQSTTAIKELPSDILSPVTESSMLLKSIYSTTSSLENKPQQNHDLVSHDGSSMTMLQTYLKERAVLDATRKRQQYLCSSSNDHISVNETSFKMRSHNNTLTDSSNGSSSQQQIIKNLNLISSGHHSNIFTLNSKLISKDSKIVQDLSSDLPIISNGNERVLETGLKKGSNNETATITSSVPENNSEYASTSLVLNKNVYLSDHSPISLSNKLLSSTSNFISASVSSIGTSINKSITNCPISVINHVSSSSTYTMADGPSPKINLAKLSLRKNCANVMPTPPANLTVVNSCVQNSKPAFIAPSGVIPSSTAGMRDDGKCKCSICHKDFAKQAQLRLHMNIHFIERPHRCDSCGISFRTNGHLQKHKRSVSHFNKVNMNQTFGAPSTENPRPFKCHDCKVAFRIHGHLAKHLRCKLHIMKLECLGKLPFGTYAEIERSGVSLNEIDTSDCENSLESLQNMAAKLYEKEPAKLLAWRSQQKSDLQGQGRVRSVSNSSTNSDDYAVLDEQDSGPLSVTKSNEEDSDEGDEPLEVAESYSTSHASADHNSTKVLSPSYELGPRNNEPNH